jgi:hypothetical protein
MSRCVKKSGRSNVIPKRQLPRRVAIAVEPRFG